MKKALILSSFLCLASLSLRADLIYKETFTYNNGPIIQTGTNVDGSTNWFRQGGTASPSDGIVNNSRLEVSTTGSTNVSRQDDINRPFCNSSCVYTSSPSVFYASFTVNCTNLPTSASTYFAHFLGSIVNPPANTNFQARVFALQGSQPGTWRLGIAAQASSANKVFPVDLARDVDYQVVVGWDNTANPEPPYLLSGSATLWVNPGSPADLSMVTADAFNPATQPIPAGYGFRQASTFGSFFALVTNLAVATTFDEAATNVWSPAAVPPLLLSSPVSATNFVGQTATLSSLFTGQGLGNMTYQWQKGGANFANPNGNSNALTFASAVLGDSGNYRVIATSPNTLSVTSFTAFLWITNPPVPPIITSHPSNTTVYFHQNASLTVVANGSGTVTYTWLTNGVPVSGPSISGENTPTISFTDVFPGNGNIGTYRCGVSNEFGGVLSGPATLSAIAPPAVSIAYLRTLVDPTTFVATNSTLLFEATGTVSTFTNLTTGNTSSYYMQDGTAGINIFATFGSTFRPAQGDVVKFIGMLSSFNSVLELLVDMTNNPATSYAVLGSGAALPAPQVIPFNITNDLALCELMLEGRIVMLTNVFFGANAGNVISTIANYPITVTNGNGETFTLLFSPQDLDTAGKTLPGFAWSVVGVFSQNLGNAALPRNQGFQVTVTRFADIVTGPPPAVIVSASHSGNKTLLSWPNVAWDNVNNSYGSNYSYTVRASTSVTGPYTPVSRYQASLLGVSQVPLNASTATGFGTVGLSADQSTITVNMNFSGLTANANAAHIHGPAGVGTNNSVLFGFSGVPNATSGAIPEQSFAITPTELGYLQNGLLYFNIHNLPYPGGEIRGQILLVPATGLTTANTSLGNTTATTGSYTDVSAGGSQKYYQVISP